MKKIFAHGKKEFIAVCRNCGCKFSYELEDIVANDYVTCPDCNVRISHRVEPNDIFSDNDKTRYVPYDCEIRYDGKTIYDPYRDAWSNGIDTTGDEWKKIRKTIDIWDDKGK